jgi:hypothetical protein
MSPLSRVFSERGSSVVPMVTFSLLYRLVKIASSRLLSKKPIVFVEHDQKRPVFPNLVYLFSLIFPGFYKRCHPAPPVEPVLAFPLDLW